MSKNQTLFYKYTLFSLNIKTVYQESFGLSAEEAIQKT